MYAAGEKIVPREIEEEIKDSYLSYAMSVIVGRALPDARDGLKPVHRRILYAMRELGLDAGKPYKKSARIVGECLGKYHPHGDTAVYDALVRMVQNFSLRYPLIDGQGNFGCFAGDTKIKLLDGTNKTFQELSNLPPEQPFYVYAVNSDRQIVVGVGRHARVTRQDAELVEVTLDSGQKVRCTPDHRFLLRGGGYKHARDLTPEDSLMAGYFDQAPVREERSNEYLRIRQTDGAWTFVHWLADAFNLRRGRYLRRAGRIRHHKDFNRFNNSPDNVERLSFREHNQKHAEHAKTLWRQEAFRAKQQNGVKAYYDAHPERREALRQRFIDANRSNRHRTPESESRRIQSVKQFYTQHPERLQASSQRMKAKWQDAAFQALMSRALKGLKKRPLDAKTRQRLTEQIAAKNRAMWADPDTKARLVNAIKQALGQPAVRQKLSANALALWRNPEYRAKYHPAHHRMMAKKLWAMPGVVERHRQKIKAQRDDPSFQRAHRRGVQRSNRRRLKDDPAMMHRLAERAANVLTLRWQDPIYRRRVMRTKIVTYLSRVTSQRGQESITPELFNASRRGSPWVPCYEKAMAYFNSPEELATLARQNHRVVSVRPLQERADVYDITVDEHHNFLLDAGVFVHNSVDGDMAAAMRYTEARLASIAEELLADIDKETVEFVPNFDASLVEPRLLPSRLPNLLVNGSSGIAVGMATNVPPHNLSEVVDALVLLIDEPEAQLKDLMKALKGPDFPTGGIICGREGIVDAYQTGRGSLRIRAKAHIEQLKGGKEAIIVTELPYQVNKASLVEHIAKLVQDKQVEGISDLRDESDKDGMRVVIETKRDANGQVVLNQLYKHTQLETTFGVIMLALVDGRPRVLSLKQLLVQFLEHRKEIVIRRTKYELAKAQDRAHILEGLKKALDHLDAIIKAIRQSKTPAEAKAALMKRWDFSDRQAQAILEMQLQRLTGLERDKIDQEYLELIKKIAFYQSLLASERKLFEAVKEECLALKKRFGDERRTELVGEIQELKVEDLIAEEDVVITISHAGYIKRLPVSAYRRQRRGGVGVTAMETKEEDFVEHLFIASTHEYLLFLTTQGRAYWLKVHEVPQAGRYAKGTAIANLITLQKDERLSTFVAVKAFDADKFLVLATTQGTIKKTPLDAYANPRKAGLIAIALDAGDAVIQAHVTDGKRELLLLTRQGKAIRFPEAQVREVGRSARGVRGIRLGKGDEVVGAELVREDATLLTVVSLGLAKRTKIGEYRLQSRGGKGIISIKVTKKNGDVVGTKSVTDKDDVMLITQEGMIVRCRVKDVRATGRNTQGVRLMKLHGKDRVTAVASLAHQEDTEAVEAAPSAASDPAQP